MSRLRVLFLGASRLVGLMERFQMAAAAEDIPLELASIEDGEPWHAVAAAGACRVEHAPAYGTAEFARVLRDAVAKGPADLVIPVIDAAVRVVAPLHAELSRAGALPVVSGADLCVSVYDKARADELFRRFRLPVPERPGYPRLAKPRFGSSSRGHVLFRDEEEHAFWAARNRPDDFVVQPHLTGTEYSVDAYVDRGGRLVGAVSRVRVVVAGGEVMVTRTERDEGVLEIASRVCAIPGWYGPLNIQIMRTPDGPFLLEVNPRFSGGVTCSIEAGLDGPRFLLRERLGRPLPERPIEWRSGLCMTRSRKDHFVWLS